MEPGDSKTGGRRGEVLGLSCRIQSKGEERLGEVKRLGGGLRII